MCSGDIGKGCLMWRWGESQSDLQPLPLSAVPACCWAITPASLSQQPRHCCPSSSCPSILSWASRLLEDMKGAIPKQKIGCLASLGLVATERGQRPSSRGGQLGPGLGRCFSTDEAFLHPPRHFLRKAMMKWMLQLVFILNLKETPVCWVLEQAFCC